MKFFTFILFRLIFTLINFLTFSIHYTIGENIIGARKMLNNFLFCSSFSYSSTNFTTLTLYLIFDIGFLHYNLNHGFFSSNYRNSNKCCSISNLQAIAKSKAKLIAIAFISILENRTT